MSESSSNAVIVLDTSKCTGCHLCELVCSFYHFGKSSISLSRIIVFKDKASAISIPMVCISCPGAPCMRACPTGAIVRDEDTGMPKVILEKCTSCGECAKACPYRAINFNTYPLICDLCGGDPQCVKVCWPGALELVELTKERKRERFIMAAKAISIIKRIERRYS